MRKNILKITAIVLCLILSFGQSFNAVAENTNSWKNKIDERIYEKAETKDEKIPVYVWLADVNHDEVIEKTENILGYGETDLAVIDEDMSEDLAADIDALSENLSDKTVKEEIREYMDKTKDKREKEKEKTDKYIREKRKNYKEKYNENSKNFLDNAKISAEDVVFTSEYAPMLIAELTIKQIEKLAKIDEVEELYFYDDIVGVDAGISMAELCESTDVSYIHDTLGLKGENVSVGVVETASVSTGSELPSERFVTIGIPYTGSTHVNNTCLILAGVDGVAKSATVYSCAVERGMYEDCSEKYYTRNFIGAVELLVDETNVSIINSSFLISDELYGSINKWVDHLAYYHAVTIVASAGNDGVEQRTALEDNDILKSSLSAPAMSYNAITVGAYDNKNTLSISDDIMYDYSSFNAIIYSDGGYYSFCKPDLVAPANMLGGGTSSAAPFVSGIIALMLELRPSLAAYPQVIKAILLASCHYKALPASDTDDVTETMSQGLTDKQGAGVVDPYRAVSITGSGSYGMRTLNNTTSSASIKITQPYYDASGLNVSIAWLKSNTVTSADHTSTSSISEAATHNLDLSLLSGSTVLKTSANVNSSTEMVYYDSPASTTNYTVKIDKVNSDSGTVRVGFAWSVDTEHFQCKDEYEGIYYLKNSKSGYYLTLNSSDSTISQSSYAASIKQLWILQKASSGDYRINSTYMNTGCLNVGTLLSDRYYNNILDSDNPSNIKVIQNSDGTLTFYKYISGVQYFLAVKDNSTSSGASVVWLKYESASDLSSSIKWYAEPYCYWKGDVDMDGRITASDANDVMNYSSGTTSFSNAKLYLADIDNDKTVTASDARTILRISAGLE